MEPLALPESASGHQADGQEDNLGCLTPSFRPQRRPFRRNSGPPALALPLARSSSDQSVSTPTASPAVSHAVAGRPRLQSEDDLSSPPGRGAAASMAAARGALSRVLATPEQRRSIWRGQPPQAPSHDRERRELEADIQAALEWNSEPLLHMTLLRGHVHECQGNHAIHQAVSCQHIGALSFLLQRGAQGLEESCCGQRPLMQAVHASLMEGDEGFRMTELLLRHGPQVNAQSEAARDTPLHDAAHRGHSALAALLLRHGADPNVRNRLGQTPLHKARIAMIANK